MAFAIPASELARWESWLEENGVAIEERRTWDFGDQRIYFRDPDRHLLEIAMPASGRSKGFQSNQSVTLIEQTLHQPDCAFRDFACQLANWTLPAPEKRSLFGE
jgi:hypothetical protein